MQVLELTLATAAENLALDEALLETAERSNEPAEILRLWEPQNQFVVVGNSSKIEHEVNLAACRDAGVPVLRRPSGGAAIVAGPGCLMYSLVIRHADRSDLGTIDRAHRFVLNSIARSLSRFVPGVARAGTSDLVFDNRKFSGNSLRWKRTHLLYHGTLLYDFPLTKVGELLKMPPYQPAYREQRSHGDFLTNLPLDCKVLRRALVNAFAAKSGEPEWSHELIAKLVEKKYSRPEWNERT